MAEPNCPKCLRAMEAGFIPDRSYSATLLSSWVEGPPTKGLLGNLKLSGKRQFPITVYRCTSCGYLESYADATP
jgi:hypothetical protein